MVDERAMKINSRGELHPIQFQMDKVQFFLDKIFDLAVKPDVSLSESRQAVSLFMIELMSLAKNSLIAFINTFPSPVRKAILTSALKAFELDCFNALESSPDGKEV